MKALLCDLNGIFIVSPKLSDRFAQDFGVPVESFLPKLSEIMEQVRRPGANPAFTYWEPVLREWGVGLSEQEFWDYWFGAEKPNEDVISFARELKAQGVMVIIISNNFKERAEYYGHYPWIKDAADAVYFSWQTGAVKPDPAAWTLAIKDHSLRPEECVYFDDQEKNLKAAASVGVPSFEYKGVEDMRRIIKERL
jgi:HAD superfamily hydrolase (TIGR01509 family)